MNFQRTVKRKNEESLWTSYARNQGLLRMANAGAILGIRGASQGFGLDVKPYVIGNYNDASGRGLSSRLRGDAGVDFSYSITPQLKSNFTLNTDFAETEVDQRRVNLTRFPLLFPEKRDFFLEGSGFFDFSREPANAIAPFFSRRIGLDENGNPQKIDYGLKLTGKAGPFDLGGLHVRTAREESIPGEDFSVFRPKRRFLRQSYVGAIYTRRNVRHSIGPDFHTAGADFELSTRRFRGSQNVEFSGFYVRNSNPAKTGKSAAYGIRLVYPNDLWGGRLALREIQQNYQPAIGFVERPPGNRRLVSVVRFSPRPKKSKTIRRFSWSFDLDQIWDTANRLVFREYILTVFELDFQAGDRVSVIITPTHQRLDRDFRVSQGITLARGNAYDATRYEMRGNTSSRRPVSMSAGFDGGTFYSGKRREYSAQLDVRPRPGLSINLNGEWNRVELAEGSFSTRLLRTTVNTQFSHWIGMASNVQYDTVSGILGWQFRFRWILKPGNDFYFVYLHNWLDVRGSLTTLDRNAATKIVYTHRF